MNLSNEEIKALESIHEGSGNVDSDILISLKNKNLVTGLVDVSNYDGEAYIVGLDTELTNLGLKAIK